MCSLGFSSDPRALESLPKGFRLAASPSTADKCRTGTARAHYRPQPWTDVFVPYRGDELLPRAVKAGQCDGFSKVSEQASASIFTSLGCNVDYSAG